MSKHISLPVAGLEEFVGAVQGFMNRLPEYKKGLEIRFAQEGPDLHVSVGGDSHYMEAILACPEPVELEFPIFLDLNYLSNFKFDTEFLHLTKPSPEKMANRNDKSEFDYRAQFRAQGMNFKIPFRKGDVWAKNRYDVGAHEMPSLTMEHQFLEANYENFALPNSFAQKGTRPVIFEKKDDGMVVYSSDDFGAFCHTYKPQGVQIGFDRMKVLYDFLIPFKKIKAFKQMRIAQSDRLTVGHLLGAEERGIKHFCWVQPNWQKAFDTVPSALGPLRAKVEWSLAMQTKDLLAKVNQATQFYNETNYRENPLEFSAVESQYGLVARLPHSEVAVEGVLQEPVPSPVRVRFQAACLRDYLSCFEQAQPLNLEIYKTTVVAYQATPEKNILYWMPIHDR